MLYSSSYLPRKIHKNKRLRISHEYSSSDGGELLEIDRSELSKELQGIVLSLDRSMNADLAHVGVPAVLVVGDHSDLQHEGANRLDIPILDGYLHPASGLHELERKRDVKGMTAFLDGIPQSQAQRAEKGRSQLQYLLTKQSSASSLGRQSSIKSLKRFAANVYKTDNVLNNCNSAFELAHQLYAVEYAYLSQIRVEEFVEILEKDELKSCMSQTKAGTLGSNCLSQVTIDSYVQWFNQLSSLTATEIVKVRVVKHN